MCIAVVFAFFALIYRPQLCAFGVACLFYFPSLVLV